jgi:hypothetical protein
MASRARKRARPEEITTRRINNCKAWTSDEDERLREFVISNASLFDIADELGRTVVAVKARAHAIGIALRRSRFTVKEKAR